MNILNHIYINDSFLENFILKNSIPNSSSVLIQIFSSKTTYQKIHTIVQFLINKLNKASLIGSSSAGIISDGNVIDDEVLISFSIYEKATTSSISFCETDNNTILNGLSKFITPKTKLLILFANTFRFDTSKLLKLLTAKYPSLVIAGGNAGDDYSFKDSLVYSSNCFDCDLSAAIIESDNLVIQTKHMFNWLTIGKFMTVTKSVGSTVYEINGKKAIDIYGHYLGDEMIENLTNYGVEFPLVFQDAGVNIARAAVGFNTQDGSITFAGEIPVDTQVKFGYANIEYIENENSEFFQKEFKNKFDGMYIYSCAARRQLLGNFLNLELQSLNSIAKNCGFITYGEFFYDETSCHSNLLNITTTFVVISENIHDEQINFNPNKTKKEKQDVILKALTTLVSRTSDELDENIHYLEQFKNAVNNASIFSITDENGLIKEVNSNFEKISGYTSNELIGKSHNIVRHPDMPSTIYDHMWQTIRQGRMWKGLIKNRRKDGKPYHVISDIVPIYNKDGSFKEFMSIRNDVTELEEYKAFLKHELDSTSKTLEENLHYAEQYESAINEATAIIKTDIQNEITYVNEKFCELSKYNKLELIGKQCDKILNLKSSAKDKLATEVLTNIAKNGEIYTVTNLFCPIYDLDDNAKEYLYIMHDITEIAVLNQEIIDTQKEVVLTMGAIGETRSRETGHHVKRVAEYSYLLAKLAGLNEHDASLLKQASPMHDIGKVGIPDSILNKPGKLTEEEFEIMKTHAQLGYEMLKHSKREILQASALVAYTHHEKWDGSGYPRGLSGSDIPIFGRITAIADVFDALGHDRVYKKAWELDKILELFQNESGKHFDPSLVKLLFDNLDKFLEIWQKFKY